MAVQIDWGLLGRPVDLAGAFQQGQAQGELQQRRQATQDILAQYAQNPKGAVPDALAVYDPQAYATLSQNQRQQVTADRQAADALRSTHARELAGTYIRQNTPVGGASMAGAANGPAPTAPNGDIIVAAAPQVPQVAIADIYEQDPELAGQIITHMGSLKKTEREDFADKMSVGAAVAARAKALPMEQRQGFIDQNRDYLKHAGWSEEDLDGFDPHDANLDGVVAIGVGADRYLDNLRSDRSEARQERSEARTSYYQARSDARASRADSRAAVRFRERDKDRAALASSGTGLRSDTSDLDY